MSKASRIIGAAAGAAIAATAPPAVAAETVTAEVQGSCSGGATGITGSDWQYGKAGQSVWGHPGYRQAYHVRLADPKGLAAVQVKGFNDQNQLTWYGVGVLSSTIADIRSTVSWGNNTATPEIRVKNNAGVPLAVRVNFTC